MPITRACQVGREANGRSSSNTLFPCRLLRPRRNRFRHLPEQSGRLGILFRATAETLTTIADPKHLGAEIGFFAVLHSWGQNLLFHPHLHCVVPDGGISLDGTRWISCRPCFFLPVRVLSRLFRRLFLTYLEEAFASGKLRYSSPARLRSHRLHQLPPRR